MTQTFLVHPIHCQLTGLKIANLEYKAVAGHVPYLSQWNGMCARHPIFSLPPAKLLAFTRNEWRRLGKRIADEEATQDEEEILQVCFLAILHQIADVKQDCPVLPPIQVVFQQLDRLFALAYWKYYLESFRFFFPEFHISRFNTNWRMENIDAYLDDCFRVKEEYETSVRESIEKEKVASAERAMIALRNNWITPASRRTLWRWVKAHLPDKYQPDCEGWLSTLFLGGSAAIIDFDREDIELADEIIQSNCPAGTGIMFHVRQRLNEIKKIYEDHHEAFSIDLADYATVELQEKGTVQVVEEPGAQPKLQDYKSRAAWLVATAKWTIQSKAWEQAQAVKELA